MSPLGKRVIVFTMMWVFLAVIVAQVYDNATGSGMPARREASVPAVEGTVQADPDVTRLAELQGCVAANPDNLECTLELATLYYTASQWAQAQVNYERAIALDPHNVESLLKLAGPYIYQLKFEQAVPTLQQAAALQPESPEIYLLLGLSLSKLEPPRMDEAVAAWERVIALAPGSKYATQAAAYINDANQ